MSPSDKNVASRQLLALEKAPPRFDSSRTMAFTDHCDLYGAVHETGINRVAHHIMRQRPSLFNYATQAIADQPKLACAPVDHTIDVDHHHNPLFHIQAPLPLLGADAPPVGLNYCAQLVTAELDFQPSNVIALPAELNPPLPAQEMAFHLKVCGGIDCPSMDWLDSLPIGQGSSQNPKDRESGASPSSPPLVPRPRKLQCFCLDVFALAHLEVDVIGGVKWLIGKVDKVDIVDIKPDALEENLNCYLRATLEALLREKLAIDLDKLFLDINKNLQNKLVKVSFSLSPNPPIPHNPAVEEDQVKAFLKLKVSP